MLNSGRANEVKRGHHLDFLRHFLAKPGTVGAVAPSSRALAELITELADVRNAKVVVEFGPGTGVFTEWILQKMPAEGIFLALEVNPEFVKITKTRCPGAAVYNDSALNTELYLKRHGANKCDAIVCSLPWASFREKLQDDLIRRVRTLLNPGGVFVTFAYLQGVIFPAGLRFKKKLKQNFGTVTISRTVWRNFPPAFVYRAVGRTTGLLDRN